jgi:serine/threonine protein kinase
MSDSARTDTTWVDDAIERFASTSGAMVTREPGSPWIAVDHDDVPLPDQGWKLHVSASTRNGKTIIDAVLPVLGEHRCSFKVARDPTTLTRLNQGMLGPTQVGKFLTVYPIDDDQAVAIATRLAEATRGCSGPRVPSDRRLRPDAPVYYRFGAFRARWRENLLGDVEDVLQRPDGSFEADRRRRIALHPDWVTDPFEANDIRVPGPPTKLTVGDRYMLAKSLSPATIVTVYLSVDTRTGRRAVLKRVPLETGTAVTPEQVVAKLRRECALMTTLAPLELFPSAVEMFVEGEHAFLAMEHIDGEPFDDWIDAQFGRHGRCDPAALTAVLASLAAAIVALHAESYVYADLKSEHVVVDDQFGVRLLDAETLLHADEDCTDPMRTPGYASPQQWAWQRPVPADDVHAFGAVVFEALTGTRAWDAPNPHDLLERPLSAMAPDAPPHLVVVAERCLAAARADRPTSTELAALLADVAARPAPVGGPANAAVPVEWTSVVQRVLDDAQRHEHQVWWTFPDDVGPVSYHLGNGVAGVAYGLCELGSLAPSLEVEETVIGVAHWLSARRPLRHEPLGGLYVGEAGVGVALIAIGNHTGRDDLVRQGIEHIRSTAAHPLRSPDLFNGLAGRLRAHLIAWRASSDAIDLGDAIVCARRLIDERESDHEGSTSWRYPDGHRPLSGRCHHGYAHGAAGIADALLDLAAVLAQRCDHRDLLADLRHTIDEVVHGLIAAAIHGPGDGGVHWSSYDGDDLTDSFWCHGTTGVTRFLVRCHLAGMADLETLLARACTTIAAQTHLGASQCHGLAGSVEVLIDAHRALGDAGLLEDAMRLASLLGVFARPTRAGTSDDDPWTPALMTGTIGIARAMARADRPGRLATLLSPCDDLLPGALRAPGSRDPQVRARSATDRTI